MGPSECHLYIEHLYIVLLVEPLLMMIFIKHVQLQTLN